MLLIICEGCDNTGKSTLAKKLVEEFNLDYIHNSKPQTNDPFQEYSDMIDGIRKDTVIDRAYLSEYVYSKLWRGGCVITTKQFEELDLQCQMKFEHVFLIHATAPLEVIKERCIAEKEELLKLDQVAQCAEWFKEIVGRCGLITIKYDSSYQEPSEVVNQIKRFTQR